jgi:hypothetical protein
MLRPGYQHSWIRAPEHFERQLCSVCATAARWFMAVPPSPRQALGRSSGVFALATGAFSESDFVFDS